MSRRSRRTSRREPLPGRTWDRWPGLPGFDVLVPAVRAIAAGDEPLAIEGAAGALLGELLDPGAAVDDRLDRLVDDVLADPRSGESVPGLTAVALLGALASAPRRDAAVALLAAAAAPLRAELAAWSGTVGRVHLVAAGAVLDDADREAVVHVLLDYDDGPGRRHLLSMHVERDVPATHLLDVRAREPADVLDPVAASYEHREGLRWEWLDGDGVGALVSAAVAAAWPTAGREVVGVEGAATTTWLLGVRRLERVAGVRLGAH